MSGNSLNVDVRVDVVYFDMPADWSVESELHGANFNLRLLTQTAENKAELLQCLGKAVHRSESIIIIGGFFGKDYIPAAVAHALDKKMHRIGLANSSPDEAVYIPADATPIVFDKKIRGALLKSGPQAIFMIDEIREARTDILSELIIPQIASMHSLAMPSHDEQEETVKETEEVKAQEKETEIQTEIFGDDDPYNIENVIRKQPRIPIEELPLEYIQVAPLSVEKDETLDAILLNLEKKTEEFVKYEDVTVAEPSDDDKQDLSLDDIKLEPYENIEFTAPEPIEEIEEIEMEPARENDFEKQIMSLADIKLEPTAAPIFAPSLETQTDEEEVHEPTVIEENEPEITEKSDDEEKFETAEEEDAEEDEAKDGETPNFGKGLKIILFAVATMLLAVALYFGYQSFV